MRTMTRMTSAGQMPRASGTAILPHAAVPESPGSARARLRPISEFADFVKTLVDRTLDIARGRYEI